MYRVDHQGRKTDLNGVPFLWDPGPLRQEELASLGLHRVVHVAVFDLDKPGDLEAYTAVRQRIAEGKSLQVCPPLKREKPGGSWLVLLEWADLFRVPPRGKDPRYRGPVHVPVS